MTALLAGAAWMYVIYAAAIVAIAWAILKWGEKP